MKFKNIDNNPMLTVVVPCHNESDTIDIFLETLEPILNGLNMPYEIILINDGSTDNTLEVMLKARESYKNIRILNLSRNFGKEAALTAGLENAKGEAIIPIDADLQHPPELIPVFIQKWQDGYDVVAGKRVNRTGEHTFKKIFARLFYKIHNSISDITIPSDIGDFRLISKKVANTIAQLPENQRFMKGIFAWVGYKTAVVEYEQECRIAGKSNYNGWRLWNFALDGITSFSTVPLRIWLYVGIIISTISFIYGVVIIIKTLIYGIDLPGYASLFSMILFLGGIQLIGIGILGEYIGRIYKESKRRPSYIIENEY
ncbi:Bactoprenol glucosyl transferase GtrB [hydrothermal vent metagenome]|uniref:Bactoprenol glucosyl transferase GtrB n=1 Tax=hydrothermal vent metagenome TaxID=652676 RepID=A0A1W1CAH1_9ZZZZ